MAMTRSPWPLAFGVVTTLHLVLNVADAWPWDSITKCVLAPILAMWVLRERGPRILALALVFCFFGDLFLTFPQAWFLAGMTAFALAHVTFIGYFLSRGARKALARWWPAALVYAVIGAVMVTWLWPGLEQNLRIPVAVYAALLATMATVSLAVDRFAGAGALAFLVADGIIAMGQADYWQPQPSGLWIMALYLLGIFYLTSASLARERHRDIAGSMMRPYGAGSS